MGPLQGLKVLEMGQLIAGPFAAKTLADFGADVVKIEPPGSGDPLRKWRLLHEGTSVWWQVQSRNKKSVALDLKSPEARDIVRRLIDGCDVLIENFKPGVMESWGFDHATLARTNPGLIMLRISGYGQTGPYKDRPGFGVVAEAMGGLRHLTGEQGRVPVRVGVSIGDTLASLHGVIGILMALHHRHATGQGQVIDVALYEAVFNCMESLLPEYSAFGASSLTLACRCCSAISTPMTPCSEANVSPMLTPTRTGTRPGSPVRWRSPPIASATTPKPGRSRYGPVWP